MTSIRTQLLGALCLSASRAVVLNDDFDDLVFDSYVRSFYDVSEFENYDAFPHFDWDIDVS